MQSRKLQPQARALSRTSVNEMRFESIGDKRNTVCLQTGNSQHHDAATTDGFVERGLGPRPN